MIDKITSINKQITNNIQIRNSKKSPLPPLQKGGVGLEFWSLEFEICLGFEFCNL